ncbi:MAG: protein kinase [Planctomycetes bacterium]|nr:protein kinase [Planctomycetota bacterium]
MTESKKCPECGAELTADAPAGICPRCLLQVGMGESHVDESSDPDAPTLISESATSAQAPTLPPTEPDADQANGTQQIGTRVRYFGDYELLEEIARGGMGVVFKARQTSLNRIVALKMILAGQLASEADVERFHTEAEAAAQLDHPGIIPIFEIGEHEEQHYFSMALVDGESLATKVAEGLLPTRDAAELVRTVAQSVQYAHERGVIHRDLKPANILIDEDGQPRITDFGLAKKVDADSSLTGTGQVLGTPSYMSPEQAGGETEKIGPLSDVYSLGAILYTLLTGRPPFQSASPTDTLIQVLQQEPVSPRMLNPKVPRDLETICLKCLEKDPRKRYPTALELGDELGRYLGSEPIQARPVSRRERVWRWCMRNPVVASLAAGLAVALVAGFVGVTSQWIRANFQWQRAERLFVESDRQRQRADRQRQRAERLLIESRTGLYANRIALAEREWRSNQVDRAEVILDKCPVEQRDWEWRYLKRLCHPEVLEIPCAASGYALAFSPDGRYLAVPGALKGRRSDPHHAINIVDAQTGERVTQLVGHDDFIRALAYSPDGKWLASASGYMQHKKGNVKLWDVTSGKCLRTFGEHGNAVGVVAFHPNGQQIASVDRGGVIRIWQASTGEEVASFGQKSDEQQAPKAHLWELAFDHDGRRLAAADFSSEVRVWDTSSGEQIISLKGLDNVYGVAFSPDGKHIAAGDYQNTVTVWDAKTGSVRHTFYEAGRKVAFSPNGKFLATADALSSAPAKSIKIWDTHNGRLIRTIRGAFNCLAFTSDSQRIACASASHGFTVKIWSVADDPEAAQLPVVTAFGPRCLVFSPDGNQIVVADDSTNFTERTEDGTGTHTFNRKTFTQWNTQTQEKIRHILINDNLVIRDMAWRPGTQQFVTVQSLNGESSDPPCKVTVWDAARGAAVLTLERPPTDRLWSLAISSDGKRVAFGGHGETVEVVSASTGERIMTIPTRGVNVAFSPDGKTIATASGSFTEGMGQVKLFDGTTGRHIRTLRVKSIYSVPINDVAFSPDGRYLAAACAHSPAGMNVVTLWEISSGIQKSLLQGHADHVTCLAFSPDGRRLVSGSKDQTIIVWDVDVGQRVLTLPSGIREVVDVSFSPDGHLIAAFGKGGARIWDGRLMASGH